MAQLPSPHLLDKDTRARSAGPWSWAATVGLIRGGGGGGATHEGGKLIQLVLLV